MLAETFVAAVTMDYLNTLAGCLVWAISPTHWVAWLRFYHFRSNQW